MRALSLTLLLAVVSAERGTQSANDASELHAFVGVHVITMNDQEILRDQTVLVRGDRIVRIGSLASINVPGDATVIAGNGRYLLPGLADMHVHVWNPNDFTLFLATGVTTVRNMFGNRLHLLWRKRVAAGDLLGPTIYTAGPILDGNPPVWPGSAIVETPEDAERAVREQHEAGYDFLKVYERLSLDAYLRVLSEAEKIGMAVDGHVPAAAGVERVLDGGQRTIEHLDGFGVEIQSDASPARALTGIAARLISWNYPDDERLESVAQRTVQADVWNCPTLIVYQRWLSGEAAEAFMSRPETRYVSPSMMAFWSQGYLRAMPPEWVEAARGGDAARKRFAAALHKAGVRLLVGTDVGNPYLVPGYSVHEELINFVNAGLSPYEALRAATRNPAECLHALGEFGTVSEGRRADLLLLSANPLDDIRNTRRIAGVMVRGRWLPRSQLDGLLEELAADYGREKAGAASQPDAASRSDD